MTGRPAPVLSDLGERLGRVGALLPSFLETRRWFGGKGEPIERVAIVDHAILDDDRGAVLAVAEIRFCSSAPPQVYALPLVLEPTCDDRRGTPTSDAAVVGDVGGATVCDGLTVPDFCRALLAAIRDGREIPSARGGRFAFAAPPGGPADGVDPARMRVRVVGAEQSNTSVIYGDALILKAFRRLQPGQNPDVEILRFLAERTSFASVPRLGGWGEYRPPTGEAMSLVVLQSFVRNRGDGWSWALHVLGELIAAPPATLDGATVAAQAGPSLDRIAQLGRATAGMHLALASGDGVADFSPETITPADVERWRAGGLANLERGLTRLRATLQRPGRRSTRMEELAGIVLEDEGRLRAAIEGLEILVSGAVIKTRHHGDYHLGQVLETDDGWVILDFEGEPLRPLAERRALHTPLRDVAGLLRSLDYARHAAVRRDGDGGQHRDQAQPRILADTWARLARRAFLDAYLAEARRGDARFLPQTDAALKQALDALEGEKALYELEYELGNRPDWVEIPLEALATHATGAA